MEHIDAIEYVSPEVLRGFGMRVLIQSVWDASATVTKRAIIANLNQEIAGCAVTGNGRAQRIALARFMRKLEAM